MSRERQLHLFPDLQLSKVLRSEMSFCFSTVALLVSLAVCLAYSDAKPTNMIFMLMDDVSLPLLIAY